MTLEMEGGAKRDEGEDRQRLYLMRNYWDKGEKTWMEAEIWRGKGQNNRF